MKTLFASLLALATLAFTVSAADVSVKITDVHLCCPKCVSGVKKAVATVTGVTAQIDQDEGDVTLTVPDTATVQKATDALTDAGYFGKTTDTGIKISSETGAKGVKVSSLKITGVHLCCGKCVKALGEALATVPGVKANTATKGAKDFEVTGEDFNDADVFAALQKAGLTGKVE